MTNDEIDQVLGSIPEPPTDPVSLLSEWEQLEAAILDWAEDADPARTQDLYTRYVTLFHKVLLNRRWMEAHERAERGF